MAKREMRNNTKRRPRPMRAALLRAYRPQSRKSAVLEPLNCLILQIKRRDGLKAALLALSTAATHNAVVSRSSRMLCRKNILRKDRVAVRCLVAESEKQSNAWRTTVRSLRFETRLNSRTWVLLLACCNNFQSVNASRQVSIKTDAARLLNQRVIARRSL